MEPRILHLDQKVAVVSKPSGMLVHPSDEDRRRGRTLLTWLRDRLDQLIYPVHRLDRASSGAICFALNSGCARELQAALRQPTARKEYLTLVRGTPPTRFHCDFTLKSGATKEPKQASTHFRSVLQGDGFTLLIARIETGRRHQIRRHLARLGHQIVGDTTYGKGKINRWLRDDHGLPRLFLHSWLLSIPDPFGEGDVQVTDPLPADLLVFLRSLFQQPDLWPGGIPDLSEVIPWD